MGGFIPTCSPRVLSLFVLQSSSVVLFSCMDLDSKFAMYFQRQEYLTTETWAPRVAAAWF